MSLKERTIRYLQERRDKIIEGGINSIPSPFKRFSEDFIGIEQKKYYIVTGSTKSGKSQLGSYLFLYTPLLYAYEHSEQLKLKVFYYALEETPEDVLQRFMSFLLYKLSYGKYRYSPTQLQSSKEAVEQEIINKLNDGEYEKLIDFFEETVTFSSSRNATGVYFEVKKYMEENGTVYKRKAKIKDDWGETKEVEAFDHYEPNNPDEYVIVIVDHASLVQPEKGQTLKQAVDKLSEYFVILRNRYGVSPVLIQQQSFENESLDAFKNNKLKPTAQGLSDSKYPSRDGNVLLGIFSPFKHELPEYKGYDIKRFRDKIRFVEVILNRGGVAGGIIPLYFDGACCQFKELPLPNDTTALNKIYEYIKSLNKPISTSKLFFLRKIKNYFNH